MVVGLRILLSAGGAKPAYASPGDIGHTHHGSRDQYAPPTETKYACSAVHGFFRSIALSVQSSLQDTLRWGGGGGGEGWVKWQMRRELQGRFGGTLFSWPPSLPCRLLTLWFDYGHIPEVHDAVTEGIKTIDIDTWLQVSGEG